MGGLTLLQTLDHAATACGERLHPSRALPGLHARQAAPPTSAGSGSQPSPRAADRAMPERLSRKQRLCNAGAQALRHRAAGRALKTPSPNTPSKSHQSQDLGLTAVGWLGLTAVRHSNGRRQPPLCTGATAHAALVSAGHWGCPQQAACNGTGAGERAASTTGAATAVAAAAVAAAAAAAVAAATAAAAALFAHSVHLRRCLGHRHTARGHPRRAPFGVCWLRSVRSGG